MECRKSYTSLEVNGYNSSGVYGTTTMYDRYDSSNSLIDFEYTKGGVTTDYYYVKNLQGGYHCHCSNVKGILDKDGDSVVEYSYVNIDIYGN